MYRATRSLDTASRTSRMLSFVFSYVNQLGFCRHLTHRYLDEVSRNKRSSGKGRLNPIAEDNDTIGELALDGRHDTGRRKVLPRIKDRLEDDKDYADDGKGEVGHRW